MACAIIYKEAAAYAILFKCASSFVLLPVVVEAHTQEYVSAVVTVPTLIMVGCATVKHFLDAILVTW